MKQSKPRETPVLDRIFEDTSDPQYRAFVGTIRVIAMFFGSLFGALMGLAWGLKWDFWPF